MLIIESKRYMIPVIWWDAYTEYNKFLIGHWNEITNKFIPMTLNSEKHSSIHHELNEFYFEIYDKKFKDSYFLKFASTSTSFIIKQYKVLTFCNKSFQFKQINLN